MTASVVVAWATLTVPVAPPGYALDAIGIPVGDAFPSDLRILTPPFNIVGAFALVFGAVYSAYIFMPKNRVMRVTTRRAGHRRHRSCASPWSSNFVASIPGAWRAFRAGTLNSRVPATILIALGGFIPGWTSGLNRFGVTWSFFIGELLGVVLIFLGLPRQHRGLQRRAAAVHPRRPEPPGARLRARGTTRRPGGGAERLTARASGRPR